METLTDLTPLLDRSAALNPDRPAPSIEDSHCETITNAKLTDVDAALRAFFTETPAWLEWLMRFRNAVVGRLGFETGESDRSELPARFEVGHQIGAFSVLDRSDDEIVMGGEDRRFGLEISIWMPHGRQRLQLSTRAHANDTLGGVYLGIVGPPHSLIAPFLTRRMASGG